MVAIRRLKAAVAAIKRLKAAEAAIRKPRAVAVAIKPKAKTRARKANVAKASAEAPSNTPKLVAVR